MAAKECTISELIDREGEWFEQALWLLERVSKQSVLNYFEISEADCKAIFKQQKEDISKEILLACSTADKWTYTETGTALPIESDDFVEIHFGLMGFTFRRLKSQLKRSGFDLNTLQMLHTKIITEPEFYINEKQQKLFDL